MQTMKLIKDLHQQGISRIGVIMRHSVRERITSVENVLSIRITEQGKKAAYRFGERLPSGSAIRLFSSPVGRCQETAACIAEGYREQGGETKALQVFEYLGPFYITDHDIMFRITAEMGIPQFLRQWFKGLVAPKVMAPALQAAETLLDTMLQPFREDPKELRALYISHDWNIFLLKEHYLGLPHEEFGEVHFLEGMVLYESEGAYYLAHHHGEPKRIDVTGEKRSTS
jgi:broad specificity phosphatase PhoE